MPSEVLVRGDGCRLLLRVSAYELPEAEDFDDANWLVSEVELEAGTTGSFKATHRVALRADELKQFRDEVLLILESFSGVATLSHLEGQVGSVVSLENGRGNLTAFVREHVGSELRVCDCKTDQSHLAQTLRELDGLLKDFSVRGERS